MKFFIVRILTQSELGWFLSFRETGRETSRQRGINFDADVVQTVFPTARKVDEILLEIAFPLNGSAYCVTRNPLRRQQKNWRLVGDAIQGKRFRTVGPGDLFVMVIDGVGGPYRCSFDVFHSSSDTTNRILSLPETGHRSRTGMIAVHESKSAKLVDLLAGGLRLSLNADFMIECALGRSRRWQSRN